jgi:hypothetical protein
MLQLENNRCRLTFTVADQAAQCGVELRDKRTGLRRQSGLVEIEMMWSPLQRFEIQNDVTLEHTEQLSPTSVAFEFLTGRSRIECRLVIALDGAEFTISVPWNSIREHRPDFFRLFGVRPLPGLLTTADTFLAPLRGGALIQPGRHPGGLTDKFLIYGQQARWEDLPLLPVCAMFESGKRGIAIIAEQGDCDTQYELRIDAAGQGVSGFSCRYRYCWPDPVDPIDRTLRYVLLDEHDAHYPGVGRRMNRFIRETWGMKTLAEKCERSPELRYSASALTMKTFHGMKDLDHEYGDGAYRLFQTFAETQEQLTKLKAAGIDKVCIQLVGWNIDGHDGRYPTRFPVDDRLGGEAGFRALLRHGQQLGFRMQVHDNYADSHEPGNEFLIRNLWGDPSPRGIWGGGAIWSVNPVKLGVERARLDMLKLRALGVAGVYYLDAMGLPLEVDYDPKRPGPRRQHAEGLAWILDRGREVFGACGTECGFAYIARHADYLGDTLLRSSSYGPLASPSPIHAVVEEWVPVWHLAFHGLLVHSTADPGVPSLAKLLEAAEIGGAPRADFSGANPDPGGSLFATQWDDRLLPAFKAKYDILMGRLGSNQFAFIENHARRGEQCYETTFSNGCVVRVDYEQKKLAVDGKEIAIPAVFDLQLPIRTR